MHLQVAEAYARVSRLFYEGQTIGTAIRLDAGIILTCRHCVVEVGHCLDNLTAFNGTLQVGHWSFALHMHMHTVLALLLQHQLSCSDQYTRTRCRQ